MEEFDKKFVEGGVGREWKWMSVRELSGLKKESKKERKKERKKEKKKERQLSKSWEEKGFVINWKIELEKDSGIQRGIEIEKVTDGRENNIAKKGEVKYWRVTGRKESVWDLWARDKRIERERKKRER